MHTARIKKITKEILQADNSNFLDITVEIVNDKDKVVAVRKLGFDYRQLPKDEGEAQEYIRAEVQKQVENYEWEEENKVKEVIKAKEEKAADSIIEAFEGQTI